MRLMAFNNNGRPGLAAVVGAEAVDLASVDTALPNELDDVIAGGPDMLARIGAALDSGAGQRQPVGALTPRYPLARAGTFICLGLNYADHAKEGGNEIPDYPGLFMRMRSSLIAAGEPIMRPRVSHTLDYEAELVVVVGRGGRHIDERAALDHVFGYTIFNDVSVREYQRKTSQWTAGKNFDRTGPVGPAVVTPDELPAGASGLAIRTRLNGKVLQDSNTDNMIFSVARTIAILSEFARLSPGDMIAMGTPSGVGYARKPPVWLTDGDTLETEIEGIGTLVNPVVDEEKFALDAAAE